ncbi:MAG: sulfotransferase [Acidimicrobiales bacterium]|nr:sulfotransferase [Acidimicrobiales bacterium]
MTAATGGRLDWVCIGAQKAGTSTLFRILRDHPDLCIPPGKEDPLFHHEVTDAAVDAYLAERFAGAAPNVRCGTVTPHYMSSPETAARVHRFAPGTRVVALLRDPVERAFSQYRMSVRWGKETRSFDAAVEAQLDDLDQEVPVDANSEVDTYVLRGLYGLILTPWFELFGSEHVHVEFTTDLDARPTEVLSRVHRFLGVEPRETGREGLRAHEGPPAHRLRGVRRPVAGALRRVGVLDRIPVERKEQLADTLERALARLFPAQPDRVPGSSEASLRARYAVDREPLERLLGRAVPWH